MTNEIENNSQETSPEAVAGAAPDAAVATADAAPTENAAEEQVEADAEKVETASEQSSDASAEQSDAESEGEELEQKKPSNPKFKWYVLHVYSGFEEKAKVTLQSRIRQFDMQDAFGEIFIPKTITERVLKSGKKKKVEKTSYPGYVLVEMDMTDENRTFVRQTPRVTGFIGGNQMDPRPISDAEVLRLTSPEAAREIERTKKMTVQYTVGERVKVIDGAFANFEGVVDEVKPEKSKVLVLVSIFGRETPVELDYTQVHKLA
jgi:transcriptional antiterminator NusG